MSALRVALMVLALGGGSFANAASNVTVTISGTVQAISPCVINNERPITASFGDVLIENIDGSYKTITIPYDLDCSGAATNQVRMQVRSFQLPWWLPGSMLVEGNNELAITFIKDGSAFAINTWANFDTNKKPVLQAVLSKMSPDSEIIEGTFSASATLMVEYR